MTTKTTNPPNKKWRLALIIASVLAVAGIAGFVFRDSLRTVAANLTADTASKPQFAIDTAQFSDWVTTGNTYHDEQDGAQATTMLVQQCEQGSHCSSLVDESFIEDQCRSQQDRCNKLQQLTDAGHCMVHFYHIARPINPDTAIAEYLKSASGFKVKTRELTVKTLSLSTSAGNKAYQLHQYDSGDKSDDYKHGVSLGYISLENSHVAIKATCDKSSQLDEVLPILSAVRLSLPASQQGR